MCESQRYDIAVIGGGPAGAAASILLARHGRSVILLEKSQYDGRRVGEMVPPAIVQPLQQLGVRHVLAQGGHLKLTGVTSAWGAERTSDTDYIFHPPGHGWSLDRARFDATLAEEASRAGAHVACGHRVLGCCRGKHPGWELDVQSKVGRGIVRADFVIHAAGRNSVLKGLDCRRMAEDKLIAVLRYGVAGNLSDDQMARLRLESTEHGWWYAADLPGGSGVIGHVTDADCFPGTAETRRHLWSQRFKRTTLISASAESDPVLDLHCTAASTSRACHVVGSDWMAVGDAALNTDPLAGQGVVRALHSGIDAARRLLQPADQRQSLLAEYQRELVRQYEEALTLARRFYQIEKRWPEERFWDRRGVSRLPAGLPR